MSERDLAAQLEGWAAEGMRAVKMKVGRDHEADARRTAVARGVIGNDVELFVDANGAYSRGRAREMALVFAGVGASWFEEPVSSDDLAGLRLTRDTAPPDFGET